MLSVMCNWANGYANNRYTGDLRRHGDHCEVTVIIVINRTSCPRDHTSMQWTGRRRSACDFSANPYQWFESDTDLNRIHAGLVTRQYLTRIRLRSVNVIFKIREVLRAAVIVVTNDTATARRSRDSWDHKTVSWPRGDRETTVRRPYITLTVVAATTSCRRKGTVRCLISWIVRSPCGCRIICDHYHRSPQDLSIFKSHIY